MSTHLFLPLDDLSNYLLPRRPCSHYTLFTPKFTFSFQFSAILQGFSSKSQSDLDEEEIENTPELHPLREAVMRAQQRREEATGIREALEAEAQEVAQLAVNAETSLNKLKKQLDEASADKEAARNRCEELKIGILEVQTLIADAGVDYLSKIPSIDEIEGSMDFASGRVGDYEGSSSSGEETESELGKRESLEDVLWKRTAQLQEAETKVNELQSKIASLRLKIQTSEESFKKADSIAAAAMEAAEEAVRNEMDCITVANETESAMMKAIADLRFLDDSSERREEEFDKKSKTTAAAAAVASGASMEEVEEATAAVSALKASVKAAETSAAAEAIKDRMAKADRLAAEALPGKSPSLLRRAQLLAAFLDRHKYVTIGAVVVFSVAGVALYQSGVLASIAAQAQAAAATASKLWAVAAELVGRIPLPHIHESEKGILETIWLLLASVLTVPLVCKLPGGSPVLGFLAGGALIGPYALGIIQDVESIRHLAELGVVFLLFNIGLELSFNKLASMGKMVFGMGTAQVVITLAAVAYSSLAVLGNALGGPGAIILGGGLALSTTAVGMQVLQDRGETGSRHGRAAFSVLLLQDLAVVVLLMLIPLLAPGPDGAGAAAGAAGLVKIAKAIGFASIKAVVCMAAIIVAGRTLLQPLYRRVADTGNAETFSALTLLVVLGTSLITQVAGLSLALGAFLAGLLLAETEYHIQVESDIGPYKGLLMGLFFMTVGMEISVGLLFAKWKTVLAALTLLITGKVAIMATVGQAFGLSLVQSLRSGLLLSPGGEFAFVLFGEAVSRGIMGAGLAKELYLIVALSMALTPYLAAFGGKIGRLLEKNDMKALSPKESETSGLSGHVMILGFGRVGQLIAQMLSEELIPFVALDTSAGRVQDGKGSDLPVYFGDAGSPAVLHSIGAERAACAVITLDTPGANYRSVWAMHKHFPTVKTFVRAHDISAGIMLERAGATAVVPEVLEPSLQLAAAVLSELNVHEDEVAETIRAFRKTHLSELQMLAQLSGSSLGYGKAEGKAGEDDDDESSEDDVVDINVLAMGETPAAA
jgi:monovalent cation:proton antiporter-2 (CPA2) family protein